MSEQDAADETAEAAPDGTEADTSPEEAAEPSTDEDQAGTDDAGGADGQRDEAEASDEQDDGLTSTVGFTEPSGDDEGAEIDVDDEIEQFVASAPDAEVADEIATLRFEVETLEDDVSEYEQRIEELESKLKRKQADFENYKKRMKRRREEEKERATEDLVTRLLDVRDNLQRAVEQDEDADIRDGIESTLRQFDRVLDEENVTPIEPEPGDDVDPERHEVLVKMDSKQPPGTIAEVHRPGYEMAEKVIRAAQVAVSEE